MKKPSGATWTAVQTHPRMILFVSRTAPAVGGSGRVAGTPVRETVRATTVRTQARIEKITELSRGGQVVGQGCSVAAADGLAAADGHRLPPVLTVLPQARDGGDHQDADDETQRHHGGDLRNGVYRIPAIDERQVVLVQCVEHQLDTDEPQDRSQ